VRPNHQVKQADLMASFSHSSDVYSRTCVTEAATQSSHQTKYRAELHQKALASWASGTKPRFVFCALVLLSLWTFLFLVC
jgi:hypothetical protein